MYFRVKVGLWLQLRLGGARDTPRYWVCFIRHLFTSNRFAGSSDLAEVCALQDAILVFFANDFLCAKERRIYRAVFVKYFAHTCTRFYNVVFTIVL